MICIVLKSAMSSNPNNNLFLSHPFLQYELLDALYVLLRQMPKFRRGRSGDEAPSGREFDNMSEFLHYRTQWQGQCRQLPTHCSGLFEGCKGVNPKTESGERRFE